MTWGVLHQAEEITKKRYSVNPTAADSSLGAEDASYGYTFTTLKPVSNVTTRLGAYRVEDDMHIDNVIETEEQGNYQDYMVDPSLLNLLNHL